MERPVPREYPYLGPLSAESGRMFQQMLDEAGVSQRELARRIGRDNKYVMGRVNGDRPFSHDLLAGLALITERNAEDLLVELADRVRKAGRT